MGNFRGKGRGQEGKFKVPCPPVYVTASTGNSIYADATRVCFVASWEISPTKTTKSFRMKEKSLFALCLCGKHSHKDDKEISDDRKVFVCFVALWEISPTKTTKRFPMKERYCYAGKVTCTPYNPFLNLTLISLPSADRAKKTAADIFPNGASTNPPP